MLVSFPVVEVGDGRGVCLVDDGGWEVRWVMADVDDGGDAAGLGWAGA